MKEPNLEHSKRKLLKSGGTFGGYDSNICLPSFFFMKGLVNDLTKVYEDEIKRKCGQFDNCSMLY